MVQYFAENLDGFAVTAQRLGAVLRLPLRRGRRSCGATSSRPAPITVDWATFAQSLTDKPVKGMLTGPVTILAWSFVRDDQPLADDRRPGGARAARRDRRPRGRRHPRSSRSTSPRCASCCRSRRRTSPPTSTGRSARSGSRRPAPRTPTQIHTHLCYSEFGEVIDAIAGLDADVTSIEAARSRDGGPRRHRRRRASRTASAPASTTSTRRACPSVAEIAELLERAVRPSSRCARSGSTPTAG